MKIKCADTGKRFNRDWIFRHFNFEFLTGQHYAITGPNGSGKSTLLQIVAGAMVASEGTIEYGSVKEENVYKSVSIAAPYLDVIEEMNLEEFLHFHQAFKPFLPQLSIQEIISIVGLESSAHKQIRYYSSGMKQRVKLAQAIFSDTSCLLLDEPCTNLDQKGIELYQQLMNDYCSARTVIVSSNDIAEYSFCKEQVNILDYKK